jgi:uncharacterized protein YcbX
MTGKLAHICRHPIKGHGREHLSSVHLLANECMPWDRHWAVAHEAAKLTEGWNPCANFTRGAKSPQLMAITATLEEGARRVTLTHPDQGSISFHPDNPDDLDRFLAWARPLNAEGRVMPSHIVSAERGMTDTPLPAISILSLDSLRDLSQRMGQELSIDRWRGNLWLEGSAPWAEWDWIGRKIAIGDVVLRIEERITRCSATTVDPQIGRVNAPTLDALDQNFGHKDFGVFAIVEQGGKIALGDRWSVQ